MRLEVMDIETDDLDAKHIWLICCKNVTTKKIVLFKNLTEDKHEAEKFKKYCEGVDKFIFQMVLALMFLLSTLCLALLSSLVKS